MGKGDHTRQTVLELACARAAQVGLEGLSIGSLAKELGMSKSGLFAHFKSKTALQVALLEFDSENFVDAVIRPSMKAQRGSKRVRALFAAWMKWFDDRHPTGCIFIAACSEFDDRPGEVRDTLARQQQDWIDFVSSVSQAAIDTGDLRPDLDPDQFAFELYGIALSLHLSVRLLNDPSARRRADRAFESMLDHAST